MTEGRDEREVDRNDGNDFSRAVGAKAARKLAAQRDTTHGVWFGLGMMGLVGWSVAVPTLLGALAGLWLDGHYPAPFSWTLALIVAGLMLGCLNAWRWVSRERQAIDSIGEDADE
ncbi:AtpZ/AtpI family protein [Guyparkeria hydrothermalis]|uniref:AtpZ/AtpI family protein n=1 Tax=Guyparkeria hydrothermalis TaxID=923 RepID=UPI002022314D|nr:AtpZ/AtpI family protein [Guyparkeria hydrothermalis]MCL7744451.1 AtpZ/AtpI family protein [Guyparkeria hydrothermalis]